MNINISEANKKKSLKKFRSYDDDDDECQKKRDGDYAGPTSFLLPTFHAHSLCNIVLQPRFPRSRSISNVRHDNPVHAK